MSRGNASEAYATGDATYTTDIPDAGVALFNNNVPAQNSTFGTIELRGSQVPVSRVAGQLRPTWRWCRRMSFAPLGPRTRSSLIIKGELTAVVLMI